MKQFTFTVVVQNVRLVLKHMQKNAPNTDSATCRCCSAQVYPTLPWFALSSLRDLGPSFYKCIPAINPRSYNPRDSNPGYFMARESEEWNLELIFPRTWLYHGHGAPGHRTAGKHNIQRIRGSQVVNFARVRRPWLTLIIIMLIFKFFLKSTKKKSYDIFRGRKIMPIAFLLTSKLDHSRVHYNYP